ncbi:MAG: sodium:calcium antiporter [Oleiphilus sp.]|nr:MAG: sodium:calcium antiporter [Oleiphilus sp.]
MEYLSVLFALGVMLLGADLLVRGAVHIAHVAKLPTWLIGLTIVGFGTSMPELTVSVSASTSGQTAAAIGNAIGSNIFNALFILGASAIIYPLIVEKTNTVLDLSALLASSLTLWIFSLDGNIGLIEACLFLVLMMIYLGGTWIRHRRSAIQHEDPTAPVLQKHSIGETTKNSLFIIVGLLFLVVGSRWFLRDAVSLAGKLGLSELFIGLTIVAAGTSLPELITSLVASFRRQTDIAVANVVGSNIFNIWVVIGASALVAEHGLMLPKPTTFFDLPFLMFVTALFIPMYMLGRMQRWHGLLGIILYISYLAVQFEISNDHHVAKLAQIQTPLTLMVILFFIGLVIVFIRKTISPRGVSHE